MTKDISVLEAASKAAKKAKVARPRTQDIRDHVLDDTELMDGLLFHENEKRFYRYDPAIFAYRPIETDEFFIILDRFLTVRFFETGLNVTTKLIKEVYDALLRDDSGKLKKLSVEEAETYAARSSFKDGKVYDFRTGDIMSARKEVICFHHFDFDFPTTSAPTPVFDDFISKTFVTPEGKEDKSLADFMLSVLAYYLSPLFPTDPVAFVFQGSGSNGKSILLDLLQSFIGEDSVSSLSMEDLSDRFAPSSLVGKRLNLVSEDQSRFVRVDKIKAMISLERIRVERKYEDSFFFAPRAKHVFSTNKDVKFDEVDFAVLRRIKVIPFFRTFVAEPPQPGDPKIDNVYVLPRTQNLMKKLLAERSAIFFKILHRMNELHVSDFALVYPEAFIETQKQIQETSSSALEFFHEYYEYDPTQETPIPTIEIYGQYENWYLQQSRPDRYKLQSKQFFSLLNKNFPGTLSSAKVWSQTHKRMSACKIHLRPKKYKINGVDPIVEADVPVSKTQ